MTTTKLYFLIISYILVGFLGWHLHSWYTGYKDFKQEVSTLDDRIAEEKKSNDDSIKTENKLSNDKSVSDQQTQQLEKTIAKDPKGFACALDPNGVRALQQAVTSHTRAR